MLNFNLFRARQMDNYQKRPADQINSWMEMLVQLVQIVSEHNDLDHTRVE